MKIDVCKHITFKLEFAAQRVCFMFFRERGV